MLKTKNQKLILIIILLLICFGLLSVYKNPKKENSPLPNLPLTKGEEQGGGQIILEINNVKYETEISKEISVYDFMTKLQKEGKINFRAKNYPGMGEFIESINGIKNSDKNWIYYINGKKAEIGVSNYKINNGDIVSWKYESR